MKGKSKTVSKGNCTETELSEPGVLTMQQQMKYSDSIAIALLNEGACSQEYSELLYYG